jgi:hypothetical protein
MGPNQSAILSGGFSPWQAPLAALFSGISAAAQPGGFANFGQGVQQGQQNFQQGQQQQQMMDLRRMQMEQAQEEMRRANQEREEAQAIRNRIRNGLLGGPGSPTPTQAHGNYGAATGGIQAASGAPTAAMFGGDPQKAAIFDMMVESDPQRALQFIAEQQFAEPEEFKPDLTTFYEGDQQYQGYLDQNEQPVRVTPNSPRWQPHAPTATQTQTPDLITLTGPDGKAVSVFENDPRLPDLINNQGYVEGKPAIAPAGKPGDLPESLKFYTEKAKPYIDAATDTRRQGSTIETALAQGNGTGDIAGITAFNKLLDPGAVVREADVSLTLAAQGLADQLAVWVQNKKEGDILPPVLRTKMLEMSRQIVDTNLKYSKERIMGFKPGATKYGVDWTDILPPNVENQLFPLPPPTGRTNPAPDSQGGNIIRYDATGKRIP